MENKKRTKMDPKRINKIFIWICFICVFIFTACWGAKQIRNHYKWLLIGFAITIVIVAILWVTLYFVAKKQNETENDKKIRKVLKQRKEEDKK